MKATVVLLIAVLCASGVFALGFTVKDLSEGLVLWLSFEEGTGNVTHDMSGHGNDAEMHGQPRWVLGKRGLALEMDGKDDYISLPKNIPKLNTTKGTISFWLYPDFKNASIPLGGILHFRKEGTSNFLIFRYDNKENMLRIYAEVNDTSTLSLETPKDSIPNEEWSNIAITQNGSKIEVYVNGTKVISRNSHEWFYLHFPPRNDFTIADAGSWVYHFEGKIDEFRVYNRCLSQEELRGMYNLNDSIIVGKDSKSNIIFIFGGIVLLVILIASIELTLHGNKLKKA